MDEYTIRTADGKIRWVWEKGRGVWDDSGRLLFLEGFITEITDRKHAESALRESEERYRTLVEHIQDGIFIIQNGVITYANPPLAQIAGYTADEITGKNFENMIAPQDRKMVLERYKARLDGREVPDTYDFHILHRDGKNGDTGEHACRDHPHRPRTCNHRYGKKYY
jgi:PAS domain S-box-containing protein